MRLLLAILSLALSVVGGWPATNHAVLLTTLNCYWFFGEEDSRHADKPPSKDQYSLKAGHLVGLLPKEAPLFIGLQEIGNGDDVRALAYAAGRRYGRTYQHLFVQGRDTATRQDVGAPVNVEMLSAVGPGRRCPLHGAWRFLRPVPWAGTDWQTLRDRGHGVVCLS
jgi:hypothetical protein